MKREFVRALLKGVEGAEDIVSQIMDANGADIESAKEAGAASIDLTKFVPIEEHEALKVEYDKRADYDDLKTQVENHVLEKENNLKLTHLTDLGCKHPELLVDKYDFTKVTLNQETNKYDANEEYTKEITTKYPGMFGTNDDGFKGEGIKQGTPPKVLTNEDLSKL